MPAIDNLFGNGAIHIADRNKKNPVATLCGQALDKDTIRYFELPENFDQATCKVCRKSFFDEDWSGKPDDTQSSEITSRPQPVQEQTQAETNDGLSPGEVAANTPVQVEEAPRTTLFSQLKQPVNTHQKGTGDGG